MAIISIKKNNQLAIKAICMLSPKILTFCIESLKYFEIINEKKELTKSLFKFY